MLTAFEPAGVALEHLVELKDRVTRGPKPARMGAGGRAVNKRQCKRLYLKRTYTVGDGFEWPWKTRRYKRAQALARRRGWIAEFDRLNDQRTSASIEQQNRLTAAESLRS